MKPLDPLTNQGRHEALRAQLLDVVDTLIPGEALPPERILAERMGVARMTLRRALADLAESGAVVRVPGRGTFAPAAARFNPTVDGSLREEIARMGSVARTRTLELSIQPAGVRVGQRLRLAPATPVLRAVRLRFAGDEPVTLERVHLPADLVPGLSAEDLEQGSLYELLIGRFGIALGASRVTVRATATSGRESQLLDVAPHSPAYYVESVREDAEGQPVEFLDAVYRGDRFQFESPSRVRSPMPHLAPGAFTGPESIYGD